MSELRQETIAVRIRTALKLKGIRQADLCKLANIPKSSLSQYLSGDFEPKQDRIYLIAKALNVSEAWLMGFDVPMERTKKMNLQLFGETPDESTLTEGEKQLLEAFRKLTPENQELALQMLLGALERLQ